MCYNGTLIMYVMSIDGKCSSHVEIINMKL